MPQHHHSRELSKMTQDPAEWGELQETQARHRLSQLQENILINFPQQNNQLISPVSQIVYLSKSTVLQLRSSLPAPTPGLGWAHGTAKAKQSLGPAWNPFQKAPGLFLLSLCLHPIPQAVLGLPYSPSPFWLTDQAVPYKTTLTFWHFFLQNFSL